jgi:hypothetical protein
MGCDLVSELLPLADILFTPRMIYEFGERRWNDIDRGKPKTRRETCPSTTLFTTNPTWIDPGGNLGLRGERPVTSHLSHDTALHRIIHRVVQRLSQHNLKILNFNRPPPSYFCLLTKNDVNESCWSFQDLPAYRISLPWDSLQVLHALQKSARAPFLNGRSYGIKMYDIEVTVNCMASLMNIIIMCQLVQKLLKVDTQTGRENGDIIAPVSSLNLNSVNQLIFVMVKCGVLFEVRTEFLNNI